MKSLQWVSEIIRNWCRKPRAERKQQITFRTCLAMKHLATLSSGLKKECPVGQEWSQENIIIMAGVECEMLPKGSPLADLRDVNKKDLGGNGWRRGKKVRKVRLNYSLGE